MFGEYHCVNILACSCLEAAPSSEVCHLSFIIGSTCNKIFKVWFCHNITHSSLVIFSIQEHHLVLI